MLTAALSETAATRSSRARSSCDAAPLAMPPSSTEKRLRAADPGRLLALRLAQRSTDSKLAVRTSQLLGGGSGGGEGIRTAAGGKPVGSSLAGGGYGGGT